MTKILTDRLGRNSLDPQHAPVSIPVGSFDIDALKKALEPAASAAPEKRDDVIGAAIEKAAANDTVLSRTASALLPDHVYVEVFNADLGIVEKTQVYTGDAPLEEPEAKPRARRTNKPVADVVTPIEGEDTVSIVETTEGAK